MYYEDYIAAKEQKKALEKAFKRSRISEQIYNSRIEQLDTRIKDYEEEERLKSRDFLGAKIKNGHFVVDLNCACGYKGAVTYGKMDFKLLGKDKKGFIYFECPKCKTHLQYDSLTGKVRHQKGILGFLFGRFN